ncbi:(2Fe-2S)-binding protein [Candidatus Peregrinibacteria bacterium]|nr:(2Fe-2S)-binding protein [Candidatus Peregrinibacteria bacterium]
MVKITVNGKVYEFDSASDKSLMEQLVDQGANIMAACGGAGICTTCAIHVKQGKFSPKSQAEEDMCLPEGQRLTCQCRPLEDSDAELVYS